MSNNALTDNIIVEFPRGKSFVAEGIGPYDTKQYGLGLIALRDISAGEFLIKFCGHTLSMSQHLCLPENIIPFPHQIADDLMFGPINENEIGIAELLNHSCSPNTGYIDQVSVCAIKQIKCGEQITIDYGFSESFPNYSMACTANCNNCRKIVKSSDWTLLAKNPLYQQYLQPYLKEKLIPE